MTIATCPPANRLRALSLGEIDDQASDGLLEHIASCSECQAELETLDDHSDSLIVSLRANDEEQAFENEAACQSAIERAVEAYSRVASEEPAHDLPERIGEYEILRPLGHGGMGSVWLARHTKLGREVAIKLLSRHRWAHPRMRERFEAEMRAIGRLSHPNIVIAHDARDVNGCAVLVTEYVDGFDLGQLQQRTGPLRIADACEIIRQVAVALQYTQAQGFVHRDIKPSNIMLSRDGAVKLLDLGLARLQLDEVGGEMTATGQALGTADYMAPEQVSDARSVDIRADIYALGCTLMKLLTGRAPFADQTTSFAKMTAHVSTTAPRADALKSDVPRRLADLVEQMLAKRPEDRPQTPAAVQQILAPYCTGSDLNTLIQQATSAEPRTASAVDARKSMVANTAAAASNPSWFNRRVPTYVAIAAGLFGFFFGLLLSIIIVITNPDGTKSILKLAEGSKIEIQTEEAGEQPTTASQASKTPTESKLNWIAYNEEQLEDYRRAGKTVMLFVTADWDLKGKQLLNSAIESPDVIRLVEDGQVIPMMADWTQPSKSVEAKVRELSRGRGPFNAAMSVPVMAIYSPLTKSRPVILRDSFTADALWAALEKNTSSSASDSVSTGQQSELERLAFGIIGTPTQEAIDLLNRTQPGDLPLRTPWGTWFLLRRGVESPYAELLRKTARIPGVRGGDCVLVDNRFFIGWDDVQEQVRSLTTSHDIVAKATNIDLIFEEQLGSQFEKITSQNIGSNLAIIVNGTVRALPRVNAAINAEVRITGTFEGGEVEELSQWLHSSLLYPTSSMDDLSRARQTITQAIAGLANEGSPYRTAENVEPIVESFLQPAFVKSINVQADGFVIEMQMDKALQSMLLKASESHKALSPKSENTVEAYSASREGGIDAASLIRPLGDDLRIVTFDQDPDSQSLPLLFIFTVTDATQLDQVLAMATGQSKKFENGLRYYQIQAGRNDKRGEDVLVGSIVADSAGQHQLIVGTYDRVKKWVSE